MKVKVWKCRLCQSTYDRIPVFMAEADFPAPPGWPESPKTKVQGCPACLKNGPSNRRFSVRHGGLLWFDRVMVED